METLLKQRVRKCDPQGGVSTVVYFQLYPTRTLCFLSHTIEEHWHYLRQPITGLELGIKSRSACFKLPCSSARPAAISALRAFRR